MIKKLAFIIFASALVAVTAQAELRPFQFGMMGPQQGRGDGPGLGSTMSFSATMEESESGYSDWMTVWATKEDSGYGWVNVSFSFPFPQSEFSIDTYCGAAINADRININRNANRGSLSVSIDELNCSSWAWPWTWEPGWDVELTLPTGVNEDTTISVQCKASGEYNSREVGNRVETWGGTNKMKSMYLTVYNLTNGIVYLGDNEFNGEGTLGVTQLLSNPTPVGE